METINKKIISSEAGRAALLFGLISGGFILVNFLLAGIKFGNVISSVLNVAKIVGCILLMKYFMVKLKGSYEGVGRKQLVRYGTLIALFSAIITAIVAYCAYQYIFPETVTTMMDELFEQMGSMLDSNSRNALLAVEGNMASLQMVSMLIYCFLYGWILSLILAPRIAWDNTPFED